VKVAGVLLAAGEGRRMGRPKALVRLDGELLVERGVRLLADGGCEPVLVVLGAAEVPADLGGARVVHNPDWASGMGSSLRAGLRALGPDVGAAVVALVDQPLIGPEAVRRLVSAWRADAPEAVVATYEGQPRNPVLLDRRAWERAMAGAVGDQGARAFLRDAYDARIVEVPCDGTGSPADLDTPEELAAVSRQERSCN
jgi:CTP:molybdopterin cytidylyltransferase MocA